MLLHWSTRTSRLESRRRLKNVKTQDPRLKGQEPRAKSQDPRVKSRIESAISGLFGTESFWSQFSGPASGIGPLCERFPRHQRLEWVDTLAVTTSWRCESQKTIPRSDAFRKLGTDRRRPKCALTALCSLRCRPRRRPRRQTCLQASPLASCACMHPVQAWHTAQLAQHSPGSSCSWSS